MTVWTSKTGAKPRRILPRTIKKPRLFSGANRHSTTNGRKAGIPVVVSRRARFSLPGSLDIAEAIAKTARPMAERKENPLMEKIVSLCKRRGFIFQSSEIYGGINGFWDYGPLGAELKRNVRELWWRSMTRQRDDVVGLDATILMHPKI